MREKIQHWILFKLFTLCSLANTWKGLRLNLNLTLSLTQTSPDSWPSLTFNHFQKSGKKCVLPHCPTLFDLPRLVRCLWWNPRWQWGEEGGWEGMNIYLAPGICQAFEMHYLFWRNSPEGYICVLISSKRETEATKTGTSFMSTAIVCQSLWYPRSAWQCPPLFLRLDQCYKCSGIDIIPIAITP